MFVPKRTENHLMRAKIGKNFWQRTLHCKHSRPKVTLLSVAVRAKKFKVCRTFVKLIFKQLKS